MSQRIVRKKIGEILVDVGKITQSDLDHALKRQKESNQKLGEILVQMQYVTEEDLVVCLATQYQYPFIKIENYNISEDVLTAIPKGIAVKYHCLPIDKIGDMVSVVVSDPVNLCDLKEQEAFLNCRLQFFVTTQSSLSKAIQNYYGV